MPAYVIVDISISDPETYERYKQLAPPSIAEHGGRYIARGGATVVLEGEWAPERLVIRHVLLAFVLAGTHVAYVLFVLFGGLLVAVWPRLIFVHLAAVLWAGATMVGDLGCPVTTWEKAALKRSGREPYPEGFLQHHVLRTRFNPETARRNHIVLGVVALAINVGVYLYSLRTAY